MWKNLNYFIDNFIKHKPQKLRGKKINLLNFFGGNPLLSHCLNYRKLSNL